MQTLCLETTSQRGSVSICGSQGLNYEEVSENPHEHAEFINLAIESCLKKNSLSFQDLKGLAVSVGPGSFTGIRVGIGVAKTLSYLLKLPVFCPTSLEVLLYQNPDSQIAVINAHKNMIYWQVSSNVAKVPRPQVSNAQTFLKEISLLKLKTYSLVGDGFSVLRTNLNAESRAHLDWIEGAHNYPTALALGKLSRLTPQTSWTQDWNSISPLYLRQSEAEEKSVAK